MPVILGGLAFVIWGLVPIYFEHLSNTPPLIILAHRILWSTLLIAPVIFIKPRCLSLANFNMRNLLLASGAGLLMNLSWLGFVYAMTTGNVMAASLAFYITPVFVFVMGFVFFGESLNRTQWIAFVVMVLAIAVHVYLDDRIPVISLLIAVLFAGYFSLKKLVKLSTFESVFIEHIAFAPIAVIFIYFHGIPKIDIELAQLIGTAPLQLVPVILLTIAINHVPLNRISVLQYLEPTLHLILAVWVFHESVSSGQVYAASLILFAIGVLCYESIRRKNADYRLP